MITDDVLTTEQVAVTLGVSTRHVRRLTETGSLEQVARGVIDRRSVENYHAGRGYRQTRAWAEHTAWGAVDLLAGGDAAWLGATQRSRLRGALRRTRDASELLSRTRERAKVLRFTAHRSALPRLRSRVAAADLSLLGLAADDGVDGYLAMDGLDDVVSSLGVVPDSRGTVALRVTAFDVETVRRLVRTSVVAALDAAASVDPRVRGVGRRALDDILRGQA